MCIYTSLSSFWKLHSCILTLLFHSHTFQSICITIAIFLIHCPSISFLFFALFFTLFPFLLFYCFLNHLSHQSNCFPLSYASFLSTHLFVASLWRTSGIVRLKNLRKHKETVREINRQANQLQSRAITTIWTRSQNKWLISEAKHYDRPFTCKLIDCRRLEDKEELEGFIILSFWESK